MKKGKSRQSLTWSIATIALLLVYAASSLRLDSIHQLFHAENISELHSAEKEHDPCHKNIYHQQKEPGCEHKSHITQNTKCSMCEHGAGSKEILPIQIKLPVQFSLFEPVTHYSESALSHFFRNGSGRGPPHV